MKDHTTIAVDLSKSVGELTHDLSTSRGRQTSRELRLPSSPVETLDLVRQDDPGHR